MPPQTVQRYQQDRMTSPRRSWRFNQKPRSMPVGKTLRIELPASARVRWTMDDWATVHDDATTRNSFGIHMVDLATSAAAHDTWIRFTFFWIEAGQWEGADFAVELDGRHLLASAPKRPGHDHRHGSRPAFHGRRQP
jgi:glucoamylase